MTGLRDGCPVGFPGEHRGADPLTAEDLNGGVLASYRCPTCSSTWRTWWGRDGWPADREIDPVTPEQARRNREVLEQAIGRTAA